MRGLLTSILPVQLRLARSWRGALEKVCGRFEVGDVLLSFWWALREWVVRATQPIPAIHLGPRSRLRLVLAGKPLDAGNWSSRHRLAPGARPSAHPRLSTALSPSYNRPNWRNRGPSWAAATSTFISFPTRRARP